MTPDASADEDDRAPDDTGAATIALHLTFRVGEQRASPEVWRALIFSSTSGAGAEQVLAEATLHRVHYSNPRWLEQLQDVVPDLSSIGSAFADRELISMIDESSLFTDSLCVISSVDVDDAAVGSLVTHSLVRAVARVFDGDTIALLIAGAFTVSDPAPALDAPGLAARRAHWAQIGFVDIPGTTSMLLPVGARP